MPTRPDFRKAIARVKKPGDEGVVSTQGADIKDQPKQEVYIVDHGKQDGYLSCKRVILHTYHPEGSFFDAEQISFSTGMSSGQTYPELADWTPTMLIITPEAYAQIRGKRDIEWSLQKDRTTRYLVHSPEAAKPILKKLASPHIRKQAVQAMLDEVDALRRAK